MRYTGIQPQYFPRLHYFARILATDVFMIRDDAQFVIKHKFPDGKTGKSYQGHSPIKQSTGVQLLLVPTKHNGFKPIAKTQLSYDSDWVENHLRTLQFTYSRAVNFNPIFRSIEKILSKKYQSLADLNITTIMWGINQMLDQKDNEHTLSAVNKLLKGQKMFRLKEIRLGTQSKALTSNKKSNANEKIVALCQEIGADEDYCGGTAVAAYVDLGYFKKNGIKITVQDWKCQQYQQLFMKQQGFIANLSIIDLLMNVRHKEAVKIIKG